jgi:hypothetical protein
MERGSYDYQFKPPIVAENARPVSALSVLACAADTIHSQALTAGARGADNVVTLLHATRQEAEFETVPGAGQSVTIGRLAPLKQRNSATPELQSLRPATLSTPSRYPFALRRIPQPNLPAGKCFFVDRNNRPQPRTRIHLFYRRYRSDSALSSRHFSRPCKQPSVNYL